MASEDEDTHFFLYGIESAISNPPEGTSSSAAPLQGQLPLAASADYDTHLLDDSRMIDWGHGLPAASAGDRSLFYTANDVGSVYPFNELSLSCWASGSRSSAMHANWAAQPAASLRQQLMLEVTRQQLLVSMMNQGQFFNGNMFRTGRICDALSCECSHCADSFEGLCISGPVSETFQATRVANRHRASETQRMLRSPGRYEADGFPDWSGVKDEQVEPASNDFLQRQRRPNYTSLEEVKGRMVTMAKEEHGSLFLRTKCIEGSPEELRMIFLEIKYHTCELMGHAHGYRLIQTLLEACNARQRMEIVSIMTREAALFIEMSVQVHGTMVVRKLVETIKPEEIHLVRAALKRGAVALMMNSNGYRVLEIWLDKFSDGEIGDIEFLIDAAVPHCVEIASHTIGCVIMKKLVACDKGRQHLLINEVIVNALHLSQDPLGNYVVQHLLGLNIPWVLPLVLNELRGHFMSLAMQKCSSNVVEECLSVSGERELTQIIRELLESPDFVSLLKGQYGNYVTQSALKLSKGYAIHNDLVNLIRANASSLRCPFGKRVLSCVTSLMHHQAGLPRSRFNRSHFRVDQE